jgi:large repetitive protein
VHWKSPVSDGGSPITGYIVTPHIGPTAQAALPVTSDARHVTLRGLVSKSTYTFTVAAVNAVGTSPPSVPSAPITIRQTG